MQKEIDIQKLLQDDDMQNALQKYSDTQDDALWQYHYDVSDACSNYYTQTNPDFPALNSNGDIDNYLDNENISPEVDSHTEQHHLDMKQLRPIVRSHETYLHTCDENHKNITSKYISSVQNSNAESFSSLAESMIKDQEYQQLVQNADDNLHTLIQKNQSNNKEESKRISYNAEIQTAEKKYIQSMQDADKQLREKVKSLNR